MKRGEKVNKDNKTNIDDIDLFFHQEFKELLDNKVELSLDNEDQTEILNLDDDIEILNLDNDIEILDFENEIISKPEILDLDDDIPEVLNLDFDDIPILGKEDIMEPEILDFEKTISNSLVEPIIENNLKPVYVPELSDVADTRNEKKIKSSKAKKFKKIFLIIDLIILFILLSLILLKIINWNKDNNYTHEQIKEIQDNVVIEERVDNENTVIIENENTPNVDNENNDVEDVTPDNDYYNFIKEPLISVDFTQLKIKNSDTVGWLQVPGTNINYPIVQTIDNDYYLRHSFDRTYNDAGWVFVDYRNNLYDDRNLIIYGHARLNLTMFGTLKNVVKSSWYTNSSNHLIKLSTPSLNTSWQVFSTYVINEENYYIKTSFDSNSEYLDFLNTLKGRSVYNYNANLSENDRILTLSTCYTDNKRVVLHAKLIKMEQR